MSQITVPVVRNNSDILRMYLNPMAASKILYIDDLHSKVELRKAVHLFIFQHILCLIRF